MTDQPKYVVCPECRGEGTLPPGFVYTQDDIDRDFTPDEFAEHIEQIRKGTFDRPCNTCEGKRVVVNLKDGKTAEERWQAELEYRAEVRAEQRMGC